MNEPFYYFSLQYSAIQKTVLRHDRLWSMAGISQILSWLNEIELPRIAKNNSGTPMVAGGGKFTAYFSKEGKAKSARAEIIELIATTFPMLEFQASAIVDAPSFADAKQKGIIESLNNQKNQFRGYGCSFNPHLMPCEECGEYPAVCVYNTEGSKEFFCNVCATVKETEPNLKQSDDEATTLEKIYKQYFTEVYPGASPPKIPKDFNNLFEPSGKKGKEMKRERMAVWCSDLNNMNQKVPIWLAQKQDKILEIFNEVKKVNEEIIVKALCDTFPDESRDFVPFRIIIAGGDDLCIVMDEKYILKFAQRLSDSLNDKISLLDANHYLHKKWLETNRNKERNHRNGGIKPYSFGGAFIVTSPHTPFRRIHKVCEELMKEAKKLTDRQGNSVNWRVMAEDASLADRMFTFEKPLYFDEKDTSGNVLSYIDGVKRLPFSQYWVLRQKYDKISSSHRYQIVAQIQKSGNDGEKLERWLKRFVAPELEKSESLIIDLLKDKRFRDAKKHIIPSRIVTLFELMGIGG